MLPHEPQLFAFSVSVILEQLLELGEMAYVSLDLMMRSWYGERQCEAWVKSNDMKASVGLDAGAMALVIANLSSIFNLH